MYEGDDSIIVDYVPEEETETGTEDETETGEVPETESDIDTGTESF
jgi:hypothetical protein